LALNPKLHFSELFKNWPPPVNFAAAQVPVGGVPMKLHVLLPVHTPP
jgi:hypothetical protein